MYYLLLQMDIIFRMGAGSSKDINVVQECKVCTAPAPYFHFGGKKIVGPHLSPLSLARSVLLLLPVVFPSHSEASPDERAEEMQERDGGLSGVPVSQELYSLSIQQMSKNWDEPRAYQGAEKKGRDGGERRGLRGGE